MNIMKQTGQFKPGDWVELSEMGLSWVSPILKAGTPYQVIACFTSAVVVDVPNHSIQTWGIKYWKPADKLIFNQLVDEYYNL